MFKRVRSRAPQKWQDTEYDYGGNEADRLLKYSIAADVMLYYRAVLKFAINLEIHLRTTPDTKLINALIEVMRDAKKISNGLADLERTYSPAEVNNVKWFQRTRELYAKVYKMTKAAYRGSISPHKAADKAMKVVKAMVNVHI